MEKKELRQLSKSQLIEIIFDLKAKIDQFEHLLKAFDNPHTPSSKIRSKKNTERDESKPRFPGKPEGSNGGGIQMPPPDQEVEVKKDSCPQSKRCERPTAGHRHGGMNGHSPIKKQNCPMFSAMDV